MSSILINVLIGCFLVIFGGWSFLINLERKPYFLGRKTTSVANMTGAVLGVIIGFLVAFQIIDFSTFFK